jgi:hypothetical protein
MKEEKLTFEQWFAEFKQHLIEDFGYAPNKPDEFYGGAESRRDQYEQGLEPYQAVIEEMQDGER